MILSAKLILDSFGDLYFFCISKKKRIIKKEALFCVDYNKKQLFTYKEIIY